MAEYHEVPGAYLCAGCQQEHLSHVPPIQISNELYAPECVPAASK